MRRFRCGPARFRYPPRRVRQGGMVSLSARASSCAASRYSSIKTSLSPASLPIYRDSINDNALVWEGSRNSPGNSRRSFDTDMCRWQNGTRRRSNRVRFRERAFSQGRFYRARHSSGLRRWKRRDPPRCSAGHSPSGGKTTTVTRQRLRPASLWPVPSARDPAAGLRFIARRRGFCRGPRCAGLLASGWAAAACSPRWLRRSTTGMDWRVSRSMARSRPYSPASHKDTAVPSRPARAVRPMRWT